MASQPTVLVTGATSGIGRALARELARRGAGLIVHGRTAAEIRPVARDLERSCARPVPFVTADLASQQAIRVLGSTLRTRFPQLSVVIHNAGVQRTAFVVVDGHEETFAVNHLAPYLLTHELYGTLADNQDPRIVFVNSSAHAWGDIHWDDLVGYSWYDTERAYAQSQLAAMLAIGELVRRTPNGPVTVFAVNPGMTRTDLGSGSPAMGRTLGRLWRPFMRRPATVARELARIAVGSDLRTAHGCYVSRGIIAEPAMRATDPLDQRRMWDLSAQLTGVDPRWPLPRTGV